MKEHEQFKDNSGSSPRLLEDAAQLSSLSGESQWPGNHDLLDLSIHDFQAERALRRGLCSVVVDIEIPSGIVLHESVANAVRLSLYGRTPSIWIHDNYLRIAFAVEDRSDSSAAIVCAFGASVARSIGSTHTNQQFFNIVASADSSFLAE